MAVAHRGAMIARGLGKTEPRRSLLLQWGHCCWGIEKGRSPRLLPPLLELPKVRVNGGGPGRQSHPLPKTVPPASWCGVRDVGPLYLPSRPAGSEVQAEKSSREDQGAGRRQSLQLGIKTEQVQRNKALICTAAAPGQLTTGGLPPRVGLVKSWGTQGCGHPQGSAWNSEK